MKFKKLIAAGAAIAVAGGIFLAYDAHQYSEVQAALEEDALLYSSMDAALSLAIYKAETKNDPMRGYLNGLQTELDQLYAEYDTLVAEEPFIKLSYVDKLIEWNEKRADLYEKIDSFLE